MKAVNVSQLKASLSRYLRRVKTGEQVLITERGKPIAYITPLHVEGHIPERMLEMASQGLLKLGRGTIPKEFWDLPGPKVPAGWAEKVVEEEREDRA